MIFSINKIPIYFPFETIYPEQYTYIKTVLRSLASPNKLLIQMPCGSGKTMSLLSACLSFNLYHKIKFKQTKKVIFCGRTVSEVEKSLCESKLWLNYLRNNFDAELYEEKEVGNIDEYLNFLGIGLASKKHMCINENVLLKRESVDLLCSNLISKNSFSNCNYFDKLESSKFEIVYKNNTNSLEKLNNNITNTIKNNINNNIGDIEEIVTEKKIVKIPSDCYSISEIKTLAGSLNLCPYYLIRKLLEVSDLTIFTYNYLLDPVIKDIVNKNVEHNLTTVIFDEAHNIDNSIIESYSYKIHVDMIKQAEKGLEKIKTVFEKNLKTFENSTEKKTLNTNNKSLYTNNLILKESIIPTKYSSSKSDNITNLIKETDLPGDLRSTTHFLSMLTRILEFLKTKLKSSHTTTEHINSFLNSLSSTIFISRRSLSFCSNRLASVFDDLKIESQTETVKLEQIAKVLSIAANYAVEQEKTNTDNFIVLFEPVEAKSMQPTISLLCLDCSVGFQPILKFRNLIITSGTLAPMEMYQKMLGFTATMTKDIQITVSRDCVTPCIVTKGNDQMSLSVNSFETGSLKNAQKITTSFNLRSDPSIVRNYANLLLSLSEVVPDGMVVFFPSYLYLEEISVEWTKANFFDKIQKNKKVFFETPNYAESLKAIENYRKCIENGVGSILFSIARGKVSEGVDFKGEYGRCVVIMGVPYQYTQSVPLLKRLEFLNENIGLNEGEFLTFDAMRHTAQCMGRVLRSKTDYGLMILADNRFSRKDKVEKLPAWLINQLRHKSLSIDAVRQVAKRYFVEMGQPIGLKYDENNVLSDNYSILTLKQLLAKINKGEL